MNHLQKLAKKWELSDKEIMNLAQDAGLVSDNAVTVRDVTALDAFVASHKLSMARAR